MTRPRVSRPDVSGHVAIRVLLDEPMRDWLQRRAEERGLDVSAVVREVLAEATGGALVPPVMVHGRREPGRTRAEYAARNAEVVRLASEPDANLTDIGRRFGLTRQRVFQIVHRANH